jgi:DNA-binding GntR family transcriptional regulator
MQNTILDAEQGLAVPNMRLERQHLHDTVVDHLRNLIVEGVLSPGTKLNERELCETLGISRTPLREAMKVLSAEGLVEILPNRGASV